MAAPVGEEARTSGDEQGWRGRLWRYGPLAAWVGLIFFASTGNLSGENTSLIVRPLLLWLFPGITEPELLRAHLLVRKTAHFAEYAVLALLAARAFLTSSRPRLQRRWAVTALLLVVACALLDEYHQSFVPTRGGSVYDSMLDTAGGASALAFVSLWRARRRRSGERQSGRRRPRPDVL
ncbi:MAG TPA: VanZ family protein [Pyrinomonadaceae bacterium]|nr:VanZ family protein [Pyrinomonadaceae bacterium]